MKTMSLFAGAFGALALSLPTLNGATITLGGPTSLFRTASLSDAVSGVANSSTGTGNATVTDVNAAFGGSWTERADVTNSGTNGMLDIQLLTGSFGSSPATGTWTITNSSFWSTYEMAAISLHVGNGQAEPDHFIWKITPGTLSGLWSYDGGDFGGGGLSNLKLFSTGSPTQIPPPPSVPDSGTTLLSTGIALLGLGAMRKLIAMKS